MGMPGVTNTSQPRASVGFTWVFAVFAGLGPICDIFDLRSGRRASLAGRRRRVVTVPNDSSLSPGHLCCFTRCGFLNSFCRGANHIEDPFRLREHRNVAAVELIGCGTHALGEESLQVRMDGAVFFADDVPARPRLPGGSPDFRIEQVGFRDALGRPNKLLLLLRKVPTEILRAV